MKNVKNDFEEIKSDEISWFIQSMNDNATYGVFKTRSEAREFKKYYEIKGIIFKGKLSIHRIK